MEPQDHTRKVRTEKSRLTAEGCQLSRPGLAKARIWALRQAPRRTQILPAGVVSGSSRGPRRAAGWGRPGPTCAVRQAPGDGEGLRPGQLLFHPRGAPLEAWAGGGARKKLPARPSILALAPPSARNSSGVPPPPVGRILTAERSRTEAAPGRRASRWRLRSEYEAATRSRTLVLSADPRRRPQRPRGHTALGRAARAPAPRSNQPQRRRERAGTRRP